VMDAQIDRRGRRGGFRIAPRRQLGADHPQGVLELGVAHPAHLVRHEGRYLFEESPVRRVPQGWHPRGGTAPFRVDDAGQGDQRGPSIASAGSSYWPMINRLLPL